MMTTSDIRNHELRRRELIRQAKLQRLVDEAQQDTPRLQRRLLILLSDLMISSGNRLKIYVDAARPLSSPPASADSTLEWIGKL